MSALVAGASQDLSPLIVLAAISSSHPSLLNSQMQTCAYRVSRPHRDAIVVMSYVVVPVDIRLT